MKKNSILVKKVLAAAAGVFCLAAAARAGFLVPDCKEDRAALEKFLASQPAACETDSDCDCYYYNVFPEDGPVALRVPGIPQAQWARLEDAQQMVRRACGKELAGAFGRGAEYSYSARCDSGRCARVKSKKKGAAAAVNRLMKPQGKAVRPGEFFSTLFLGLYGLVRYILPVFLLCAGLLIVLGAGVYIARGAAGLVVFLGRRSGQEEPAAGAAGGGTGSAVMRGVSVVGILLFGLLAIIVRGCYTTFGPRTFSEVELNDFCVPAFAEAGFQLQPGDRIVKGGKTDSWMDSSSFCLLKTSPERTRAFTAASRGPQPPASPEEDPLSCRFYDAKRRYPRWWRGGDQPGAACFDSSTDPNHPRGVRVVIFDSEGLVFVEKWHS